MEEMGAKFDSLADSLDDPVASLDEAAPREGAGLPALDRLERSPGGSSPGSPAAYRSQEGASKGVAAGRRWSEGGSREAHGRGKGQGQEDEEGPWEGGEGGGTPEAEGTPDAGTPTFGTSDGGVPGGDGTPPQSGFGAAGSFPASSSLSQFNGAPASSLHDRRPLLFGPGGRSARFPQMARSSSKVLAAESIPTWKPGGQKNMTIRVLQRKTVWEKALNTYSWVLKLNLGRFALWAVSAPVLLAALFTPLFLAKWRGFGLRDGYDDGWISREMLAHSPGEGCSMSVSGVCQAMMQRAALVLHVFIYALSLCTSFKGSPLTAISPSVVFLSNALNLFAQLLFVFVSGAVFARIARPGENVLAADKMIISYQVVPGTGPDVKRVLFTRLALVGVNRPELVNVTISIDFRIFMATSTGSYFVPVENLSLVTGFIPLLRFGFMVRHVIDETSPLYEYSEEDLRANDASFMVSVSGLERSSMHPFFYKRDYFAHDGDIVYDRDFEDMLIMSGDRPTFDHSRLNLLRPEATSF